MHHLQSILICGVLKGISLNFGKGFPINISHNQSINTQSSTEVELVAVDDAMGPIDWTKHYLAAEQGYDYKQILHQDSRSAMLFESKCRKSALVSLLDIIQLTKCSILHKEETMGRKQEFYVVRFECSQKCREAFMPYQQKIFFISDMKEKG